MLLVKAFISRDFNPKQLHNLPMAVLNKVV